jgi:hypothetical protein
MPCWETKGFTFSFWVPEKFSKLSRDGWLSDWSRYQEMDKDISWMHDTRFFDLLDVNLGKLQPARGNDDVFNDKVL